MLSKFSLWRTLIIALVITSLSGFISNTAVACEIRHPGKQEFADARHEYPRQLLQQILKVTEAEYGKCKLVDVGGLSQRRQIMWLQAQDGQLDVAWLPASNQTNEVLNAIPFPIRKGLLGWRVLLINKNNLDRFDDVKTLNDLNVFTAGYGSDWGDLPVMQHNFARVITSSNYDSLFEMLNYKRFDFLSRSVYEAFDETILRRKSHPDIVIEPNLALRYPQVDFFYVGKNNKELAARIRSGLDKLHRSGRFNTLFYGFYADYIRKIKMADRLIIEIENPYLPENVPHNDPELWFQLNEVDKYAVN
ncbi:hypothetical protein ACFO4O_05375 [Glaciecola siphonariae]|uniref:Solute-binding protein family 3/N-terminal domain-containing protein n=1 Tax=Glaciecola siphonariae TaxID=521012 RepID=A0ABV9LTH0_9ALTE